MTHPKCCTTLGNMAASWSMDGYWYLWHREARDSGYGAHTEQKAGTGQLRCLKQAGKCHPPANHPIAHPGLPWALTPFRETHQQGITAQAATTQQAGR